MKRKQWPLGKSDSPCSGAQSIKKQQKSKFALVKTSKPPKFSHSDPSPDPPSSSGREFSAIPHDALVTIAASFTLPDLRAASLVCRAWRDALQPLREAMVMFKWGKRFKHGRAGAEPNLGKALDSFLKAAALGSILAMVDAGLIYWEMGKREEAILWYRRAAELGDPAGQCNLAISFLQANPPNMEEAIEWLYKASNAGHARAQYQLALCFHQGQGVEQSLEEAASWYSKSAKGGYARAMYNTSVCYSLGEGLHQSSELARKWFEDGSRPWPFQSSVRTWIDPSFGETINALVYLELATRSGETAAAAARDVASYQLPATTRSRALLLAEKWRPLP